MMYEVSSCCNHCLACTCAVRTTGVDNKITQLRGVSKAYYVFGSEGEYSHTMYLAVRGVLTLSFVTPLYEILSFCIVMYMHAIIIVKPIQTL